MAKCDKPLFQTALTVQVGDVNYGGHLANDAVLRLCHEVRMRWLAKLGWSEMDAGGAGLIMADAAVQYLAQGHHGDELSVEMGAAGMAGVGFSLLYRIRRISDGLQCCFQGRRQTADALFAIIKTHHACLYFRQHKAV